MKAMILAAGFGTRLRPLTDTLPKPLVPVAGVPNIIWVIERLKAAGIVEFVVNLHYLPEPVVELLGDGRRLGVEIQYSRESEILGTGGGIRRMLPLMGDDTFLVVNGDVLFAPDISALVREHRSSARLATMVVRKDPDAERLGAVGLDETHWVRRLVWAGRDTPNLDIHMFTGMHIIEPALQPHLPETGCIVRNTYIPLVESGAPLYGAVSNAWFSDLGTPSSYIDVNRKIAMGELSVPGLPLGSNGAVIGQNVTIGSEAKIGQGCVVGDGAHIGDGVQLSNAVVMPGATVSSSLSWGIVSFDGTIITP